MDTFSRMKESIFHAEKEEPVPDGIHGTIGCAGASWSRVESLARECEPCAATIHDWIKQAGADDGDRDDRLTSAELEELRRLRCEVEYPLRKIASRDLEAPPKRNLRGTRGKPRNQTQA
jgi:transposase-like protein